MWDWFIFEMVTHALGRQTPYTETTQRPNMKLLISNILKAISLYRIGGWTAIKELIHFPSHWFILRLRLGIVVVLKRTFSCCELKLNKEKHTALPIKLFSATCCTTCRPGLNDVLGNIYNWGRIVGIRMIPWFHADIGFWCQTVNCQLITFWRQRPVGCRDNERVTACYISPRWATHKVPETLEDTDHSKISLADVQIG